MPSSYTPMQIFLFSLAAVVVLTIAWLSLPGRTSPIREGPDPIAQLMRVPIGGMDQALLIRGQDRSNPVLLWLHGGPGTAQMPLAHVTTAPLEADFTVVHWDQRGAGLSNPFDFDESTMSIGRFVADAHEVTQLLKEMFEVDHIVLLGHSWGSMLGARLAARYPEDYSAFIGVNLPVSTPRTVELSLAWVKGLGHLPELSLFDFDSHARYRELMQIVEAEGGGMGVPVSRVIWMALRAREYSLIDYLRWLRGARRGGRPMWDEYRRQDLMTELPEMPVPVYLISGARDMNTPPELSDAWLQMIEAPMGRQHLVFEQSGHAPFLTEPARFTDALRQIGAELGER